MKIVLGSGSPRRAKILLDHGVEFEVVRTDAPEVEIPGDPEGTVCTNARAKHTAAVAAWQSAHPGDQIPPVLAADTIVWFNGRVYGKPCDIAEAKRFLRELSGNVHQVFTGVAYGDGVAVAESRVTFQKLSDAVIDEYVARVNPLDRAGAYDIDESGNLIVARFDGEYENVMGLPLAPLRAWGIVKHGKQLPEYETAGIETIARGVCVCDGKVLLCRAKGSGSTYLPGGHIEFGEKGREALEREIMEEMGVEAKAGEFLGVVENSFLQHGKPHAEINLVYTFEVPSGTAAVAREDWIEFEWRAIDDLDGARLLPVEMVPLVRGVAGV